mgnify:CR=1 FL=1
MVKHSKIEHFDNRGLGSGLKLTAKASFRSRDTGSDGENHEEEFCEPKASNLGNMQMVKNCKIELLETRGLAYNSRPRHLFGPGT